MKLSYIALIGGSLAATIALFGNSSKMTYVAFGLALASIEVILLVKAAGGFTPVVIPIPVVNTVLLSSVYVWDWVSAEAKYGISLKVPEEYQLRAALIGIVFSAAYTLGALWSRPQAMHISLVQISGSFTALGSSLRLPDGPLVAVGFAGIALSVYGWQGALLRGEYLKANGPVWAEILSTALTPLAILALCVVAARPGPWRAIAIAGIAVWFVILFGRSSRSIAALPAMMLLALAIASGRSVRMREVFIATASTLFLLQLAIFGRGNPDGVGVIPLGEQLLTRPDEILSDFSLYGILGNIWISGPLTAVVSHRPIQPEALWISINPLPGGLAGWPEIQKSLRLNDFTPYNSLGELSAHGWTTLVMVAFAAGFAFSLSTRIASRIQGPLALIAMVVVLATVALFSVTVLQYNLRTAMRLVWYTILGVAALWFTHAILSRPAKGLPGSQPAEQSQDFIKPSR